MPAVQTTSYTGTGIVPTSQPLAGLLHWVGLTLQNRSGVGAPLLGVGHYANVIRIGDNLGLALSTDGVGSKLLVAEMMNRYDTVGIDCVAMNANDLICIGADPVAMLDYIAVQQADGEVLEQIGRGLHEGARQAEITIPGGELAQLPEMIRGFRDGAGVDLVGACVGLVTLDRLIDGSTLQPGHVLLGFASSGIHSNGLTLARRVLLADGEASLQRRDESLQRSIGEELLEPTRIYVRLVKQLLGLPVRPSALYHITGEGILNLNRGAAPVGYEIDLLPAPPGIFRLIAREGGIAEAEMYRVFNMGIGFCIAIAQEGAAAVEELAAAQGVECWRLGRAIADERKRIHLRPLGLTGEGERLDPA